MLVVLSEASWACEVDPGCVAYSFGALVCHSASGCINDMMLSRSKVASPSSYLTVSQPIVSLILRHFSGSGCCQVSARRVASATYMSKML